MVEFASLSSPTLYCSFSSSSLVLTPLLQSSFLPTFSLRFVSSHVPSLLLPSFSLYPPPVFPCSIFSFTFPSAATVLLQSTHPSIPSSSLLSAPYSPHSVIIFLSSSTPPSFFFSCFLLYFCLPSPFPLLLLSSTVPSAPLLFFFSISCASFCPLLFSLLHYCSSFQYPLPRSVLSCSLCSTVLLFNLL